MFAFPHMVRATGSTSCSTRLSGPCGALAWRMAAVGGCHTTMCVGPAARRVRAVGRCQANEAETGVATGGQTTDRAAPRRSRKTASVLARDDFLPRWSAGGAAHTWWRLSWGATGRWWSLPSSAHLLCATGWADATLDPALFRPEILLLFSSSHARALEEAYASPPLLMIENKSIVP